jgi:hypothetical protein
MGESLLGVVLADSDLSGSSSGGSCFGYSLGAALAAIIYRVETHRFYETLVVISPVHLHQPG